MTSVFFQRDIHMFMYNYYEKVNMHYHHVSSVFDKSNWKYITASLRINYVDAIGRFFVRLPFFLFRMYRCYRDCKFWSTWCKNAYSFHSVTIEILSSLCVNFSFSIAYLIKSYEILLKCSYNNRSVSLICR